MQIKVAFVGNQEFHIVVTYLHFNQFFDIGK